MAIDAGEKAVRAFKALKRYDPKVELGPSLALLRSGETIVRVNTEGPGGVNVLTKLLALVDDLDGICVTYELSITDGTPQKVEGSPPVWPTRVGERADLVSALDEEQRKAKEEEEAASRRQVWLNSPEGQEYTETMERLDKIRDFLRSRWHTLGFDNLRSSEQNYLYVWWLYVEVMNGAFDQYFNNSTGDSALCALSALQSLSAREAHAILSDAIDQFELVGGFQTNRNRRSECLEALPKDAFDDTTRRFYNLTEDIRSIALLEVERDYKQHGITPQEAR